MSSPSPAPPDITVCALLYGDHRDLAARCLNSLLTVREGETLNLEYRVGLNACFTGTVDFVTELANRRPEFATGAIYKSDTNIYKYPMMRSMLWQPPRQVKSEFVAWFDDDSFLTVPVGEWAAHVLETMRRTGAAMLGAPYTIPLQGAQADWVEDQPWYAGQDVRTPGYKVSFVTGGYWVIRTEVLQRFDWPLAALRHNGGDVMLGELLHQQQLPILKDRFGVAINADAQGVECRAGRRGFSERPIGYSYSRNLDRNVLASVPTPVTTTQQPTPPQPAPVQQGQPVRARKPFALDM